MHNRLPCKQKTFLQPWEHRNLNNCGGQEGIGINICHTGWGGGPDGLPKFWGGQFFLDDHTTYLRPRDWWMIKNTWEYHNSVVNEHVNQIPHLAVWSWHIGAFKWWHVFEKDTRELTYSCDQNIEQGWCKVCGHSITGRDANLLSHQASKVHKNRVQESKKKPTIIIKNFAPQPKSQPPQWNPSSAS
jgi:hypothetical protein